MSDNKLVVLRGRRDQLALNLGYEHAALLRCVDALPEEHFGYRPHERSMSAADLLWHTATAGKWLVQGALAGAFDFSSEKPAPAPSTKAELRAAMETILAEIVTLIQNATDAQLSHEFSFMGGPAMPGANYLDWHLFHLIHHRGQATVYLRAMGAKVPAIYGPSGDEQ